MAVANSLAYYITATIMAAKSFILQVPVELKIGKKIIIRLHLIVDYAVDFKKRLF